MAANKFATMLHRNTHKIPLTLVYAVLEWFLIFLLLLNSLFSFLVSKFAIYFGLKPPCLWCSRLDHHLDPNKSTTYAYRDLVCEAHAAEISRLGYCHSHRKLAEPQNLCTDCLSTRPKYEENSIDINISRTKIAFSATVSDKRLENGEESLKCSCCDESLSSKSYPSEASKSGDSLSSEAAAEEDCSMSVSSFQCRKRIGNGGMESSCEAFVHQPAFGDSTITETLCGEDESFNPMNRITTFSDVNRLVPLASIDSSTIESQAPYQMREQDQMGNNVHLLASSESDQPHVGEQVRVVEEAKRLSAEAAPDAVSEEVAGKTSCREAGRLEIAEPVNFSSHGVQELDNKVKAAAMEETGSEQIQVATSQNITILASTEDDRGIDHLLPTNSQLREMEEDIKFHETPKYMEAVRDGSAGSEMEGGNGALTIEKLKSALRAEREALIALHAELEEERSAAAIAANQTMAMITRLQEEKAAMQMEALQYQRMMDEQSEYDQEALQLLNELMMKREKEKQDLEEEVEIFRKKVSDYEAKERRRMFKRKDGSARSRNSSACGNINADQDNYDELSIDLNGEGREEGSGFNEHQHQEGSHVHSSPDHAVPNIEEMEMGMGMGVDPEKSLSTLDESLAEFEEERLSILEELKSLEEKLFTLAYDQGQLIENVKPCDDDYCEFSSPKEDGAPDGVSRNLQAEHYPESNIEHSKAIKKLLHLFDADSSSMNDLEEELNEEPTKCDLISTRQSSSNSKFGLTNDEEFSIEEEVNHVYERLQALETDRDFLKHCISSLTKGDRRNGSSSRNFTAPARSENCGATCKKSN